MLKPSVVKPVITTMEKSLVIKTMGLLKERDIKLLHESLQEIHG